MAESLKQYILMHQDTPVAELKLDRAAGVISSVGKVFHAAHVPVGIPVRRGMIDRGVLNEWWRGRSIPASRMGIKEALQKMHLSDTGLLLEKCLGLSLSDQYWIRPDDFTVSWRQVNFFENDFSEDVGNILLGREPGSAPVSLMSPDNTSDGWLKKKWTILNGKRCLLKGGSGAACQEPYNEVMASYICECLHIPHVSYRLVTEDEYPYSVCEDFITPDTELVTAWYVMQTAKKPNHISVYGHYLDCCERLGVPGIREAVDRMLVLDYLIANEDRHQNNFGVIRRADTLEYVGPAPVYDSGTSLWFDKPVGLIRPGVKMTCKPFKNTHEEQIKLVTDFDWLDISALSEAEEILRDIVKGSLFVDEARCEALCRGFRYRVEQLEKIALSAKKPVFLDDRKFDVRKDQAYSGKA